MKNVTVSSIIFAASILFAQDEKTDPFQGNYVLGSSSEIVLFWHYDKSQDSTVNHKVFDYYGNSGTYFLDSSSKGSYIGSLGAGYNNGGAKYNFDAITGDFNGDGLDDIISAWETSDNSINIVIPEIDKNLTWNDENVLKLSNVLYPSPDFNSERFKLIKGFFDNDSEPEFALAFWNSDGNIEIRIYDVDPNSLNPVQKALIDDEFMDPALNNSGLYDIAAGDFDGDLHDEIVLIGYEEINDNTWSLYSKIYDYVENAGNFSLVPKVKKDNFFTSADFFDPYHKVNSLAAAAGCFKNNTLDQFVVNFVLYRNGSETYNKLLPASVTLNLDTINVNLNNLENVFQTLGESYVGIGIITGDINNDGRDEIIADGDGRITIYTSNDTLKLNNEVQKLRSTESKSKRRLTLADLDASTVDTVWHPEIIVSSVDEFQPDNSPFFSTLELDVFEPIVDLSGDITSIQNRASVRVDSAGGLSNYYWALAAGDFDGGGVRLGIPNYYSATDIVQPLVILNAPPTHFDVFNDTTFDINKSYNGQASNFYSKYYTSSETEIEVGTEVHSGWTLGGSVSGTFVIPKLNIPVAAKIEGEYGQNFSKKTTDRNVYRVNQNITSSNDDYIYATIIDYDIWEYPIFANDTLQGYALVVSPKTPQKAWFPSKSPQASEYIPDHEVGNILSYNQITSPSDNSSLKTSVKWNTSDEVTLDGSAGFEYNWSLENENSTESTETNEVNWNVGASVGFDIPFKFIPNFEIHGKYTNSSISTQTNKVTYKKGLDVHLGPIDLGIGETYYSVTPYAYWAKSGALVLDYAVNPRPSGINVPETWWQQRYSNKPDPALILPWRLDPEKGFAISDDKRQQTKEIIFNPDEPKPLQTINIQARIHNYSLLNTSGPVNAKFYLGDPNNGGTLIESNDSKTIFSTDDFIEARSSKIISFDWTLPENAPYFPRIYIVIDPDNQIDEIHESNNIGWKVLNYKEGTVGINVENKISTFELSQNYPNPFNPITTINYSVSKFSKVEIKIFDVLGREIKTLINEEKSPGQYTVQFNANNLSSGVYFYRMHADNFLSTKKLILLK